MVDLQAIIAGPLADAYKLLPPRLNTPNASVQVLATCGQESGFQYRTQLGGGPAHGWPQFELGKPGTGAGVYGVFEYPVARDWLRDVCAARHVSFDPLSIYEAIITDDVLALALARLGYYTNSRPLPLLGQEDAAWAYYLGTWHPGDYERGTPERRQELRDRWDGYYRAALAAVRAGASP